MKRKELSRNLKKYPAVEHLIRALALSDEIGQRLARRVKRFDVHTLSLSDDLSFSRGYYVTKANDASTGHDVVYHEDTNILVALVDDAGMRELSIVGDELVNDVEDDEFHRPCANLIEALRSQGPFTYVAVVTKTTRWEVERAYSDMFADGFEDLQRGQPATKYSIDIYLPPVGSILGLRWLPSHDGVFRDPETPGTPFNAIRGLDKWREMHGAA